MKTCVKCGVYKLLSDFYRHPKTADGLFGKCKDCARQDVRNHNALVGYDRERSSLPHRVQGRKDYNRSEAGRLTHQKALRRQIELHPNKYKARVAVGNAIRDGRLTRQPCSVCGCQKSEGHHDDYSKPLEVRWLCNSHHRAEHKARSI